MKLMKNKKYLQQKFSRKVLLPQTTADFTSRVSKSYVPFTCKFPMVMNFMQTLLRRSRSKTNFYVFSYDKISLKLCESFRFFLEVFMEKIQKIRYLSYVRRRIGTFNFDMFKLFGYYIFSVYILLCIYLVRNFYFITVSALMLILIWLDSFPLLSQRTRTRHYFPINPNWH